MSEIRFSYNPFSKDFIDCDSQSHSIALYNKGKQKLFDEYIRGIILGNVLYLRTYYPFENLDELNLTELNQCSRALLTKSLSELLDKIKEVYSLENLEIKYNVTNDLLTGKGLANI